MRNLFLIFSVLFMAACSSDHEFNRPITKNTLTHKAFHYHGLDEVKDRQLIKEITGVDPVHTEWCAAFVNMVLLENDLPQSSTVSNFPLTARSFLQWGNKVDEPKQGDILVFKRGEPWQGHVGFYVNSKVLNGKRVYYVLGGNQNDKVSIITYPADRLISIRRIDEGQNVTVASLY